MSATSHKLELLQQAKPALPTTSAESVAGPVKPRLATALRAAWLANVQVKLPLLPPLEKASPQPPLLFQVPAAEAPVEVSRTTTKQQLAPPVEIAASPEMIPAHEFIPVESPATLLREEPALRIPSPPRFASLPRATDFELAAKADLLDSAKAQAFHALLEVMRRDTRLYSCPFIAIAEADTRDDSARASARVAIRWMEELGRPVLLIDGSAARRHLSHMLGRSKSVGWTQVLSGLTDWATCVTPTSISNLHLLPSGERTDLDPLEISGQLTRLMKEFAPCYSAVIVDVGSLADEIASHTARLADAAYLVLSLQTTEKVRAVDCIARLRSAGGTFRGCITLE